MSTITLPNGSSWDMEAPYHTQSQEAIEWVNGVIATETPIITNEYVTEEVNRPTCREYSKEGIIVKEFFSYKYLVSHKAFMALSNFKIELIDG